MPGERLSEIRQLTDRLSAQARAGDWQAAAALQSRRRELLTADTLDFEDPDSAAGTLADLLARDRELLQQAIEARHALQREWRGQDRQTRAHRQYVAVDELPGR